MAHRHAQLLEELVEREYAPLQSLPESLTIVHPGGEGTWSPKEELGHLIDSAINNHVRFVRASIEPEFRGPTYAQDDWVQAHGYHEMPWHTIIELWLQYNTQLAIVLERIPDGKMKTPCTVGDGATVSLRFLVEDYLLHTQHHIDHLLGRVEVTAYPSSPIVP